MRRSLLILSAAMLMLVSARGQQPDGGERKRVEFRADYTRSVPGMPDSVMRLTGNVVMYHNGAVLTCDSAYRFGSKHMECYGRVLINKDSTYIYGDRALYDGQANNAQVFAPLIKVVDGDGILYTYNFSFNTLDNIGRYWGRGTMTQKENMLESDRGYYYADTREFVAVDNVQATDPEYKLESDSVRYNMDTETAEFFTATTIWNSKGEILNATRGIYHNRDARYEFTRDTYLLTKAQEVWCDTLDYDSRVEDAVLRRDIQIRDDEQQVMAFGDYGQYWGAREEALLTKNPSALSFDPEQDTLYLRSDTMFIYSLPYELDFMEFDSMRRIQGLMTIGDEQSLIGDSLPGMLLPPHLPEVSIEDERHKGYVDDWTGTEDPETRERLRWMVVELKRGMFVQGDTLTREMLSPGLVDTLLNTGYSSEDIEAQLLYNKRKRELEAEGLPVKADSLIYEVLDAIGAFGNPTPPTEAETVLDSLRKTEPEMKQIEKGEAESEAETEIEIQAGVATSDTIEESAEGSAEERKPLTRRERRRLERENKTAGKEDAEHQGAPVTLADSVGGGLAGSIDGSQDLTGGTLTGSVAGMLRDSLGGMLQGAGVDPGMLLDMLGGMDLSTASDSLRNKLLDMGLNPDALLRQAKELGLDALLPQGLSDGDTLADGTIVLPDSTMRTEPDSLATPQVETDSLQRVIFAYRNVRIFRTDMQAVCDSLVAFSKDSTAHLYIDPVMWNKQNQITSDVIDIFTKNRQIERAFFNGSPLMVSEVDSTQFNQIKGREMEAFFRNNEIYWHSVTGNAQTLYYMMDEAAGEPNGFLVVNSASIAFLIEDQDIKRMTWYKETDAAAYPLDNIPLDVNRFLDGFSWEIARRPELKDVFDRSIRPSQRAIFEALPLPLFPISGDIERDKKRFTEMNIWEDRTDTLAPVAIEFLHTLGVI